MKNRTERIISYTLIIIVSAFCLARLNSCFKGKPNNDNSNSTKLSQSLTISSDSSSVLSYTASDSGSLGFISSGSVGDDSSQLSSSGAVDEPVPFDTLTFKTVNFHTSNDVTSLIERKNEFEGLTVCTYTNDSGNYDLKLKSIDSLNDGRISINFTLNDLDIVYENWTANDYSRFDLVRNEFESLSLSYDSYSWQDFILYNYCYRNFFFIQNQSEVKDYNLLEVNFNSDEYLNNHTFDIFINLPGIDYRLFLNFKYSDGFEGEYFKTNPFIKVYQVSDYYSFDILSDYISEVTIVKLDSYSSSFEDYIKYNSYYIDSYLLDNIEYLATDYLNIPINKTANDLTSFFVHLKGCGNNV